MHALLMLFVPKLHPDQVILLKGKYHLNNNINFTGQYSAG